VMIGLPPPSSLYSGNVSPICSGDLPRARVRNKIEEMKEKLTVSGQITFDIQAGVSGSDTGADHSLDDLRYRTHK
jgi:hypothetical protein